MTILRPEKAKNLPTRLVNMKIHYDSCSNNNKKDKFKNNVYWIQPICNLCILLPETCQQSYNSKFANIAVFA